MHREILGLMPEDPDVDHRDGEGLNNRRSNLRLVTNSQNNMNSQCRWGALSKYKGVSWHKRREKWQGRIKLNGKEIYLGYFDNEKKAARAYDEAAKKHFGEFARLNFSEPMEAGGEAKNLLMFRFDYSTIITYKQ